MSSYLNSFMSQAKVVVEDVRKQVETGEYAVKAFDNLVVKKLGPFPKDVIPLYFPPIVTGVEGVFSHDMVDVEVRVIQSLDVKDDDIALLKLITANPYGKNTGPSQRLCARLTTILGIDSGHLLLAFPIDVTVFVDTVEVLPAYGSSYIGVVLSISDLSRVTIVADNVTSVYFHAKHYRSGKHLSMLACAGQFVQEVKDDSGTVAVIPSGVPVCHDVASECPHVLIVMDVSDVKAIAYVVEKGPAQLGNMHVNVHECPTTFIVNYKGSKHCLVHPQLTLYKVYVYNGSWSRCDDVKLVKFPTSRI